MVFVQCSAIRRAAAPRKPAPVRAAQWAFLLHLYKYVQWRRGFEQPQAKTSCKEQVQASLPGGFFLTGACFVRPFLADPATMRPIPVRVIQRLEWHHSGNASFVVVVRSTG